MPRIVWIASVALTLITGACASSLAQQAVPRPVSEARATTDPGCTLHADSAAPEGGDGTAEQPFRTIAAAIEAAENGSIICVAEGEYREQLRAGEKAFTLAGGFRSGSAFRERDSALFVSKAVGDGSGSFLRIEDPAPPEGSLTAVDGFEISGYSQAIVRTMWYAQNIEVTNNHIHDNVCAEAPAVGAGVSVTNASAIIRGNIFRNNSCARGGAVAAYDDLSQSTVIVEGNLIENNHGTEPDSSHGGAVYLFGKTLTVIGNRFAGNSVTGWGAGLYVGAYTPGGVFTNATMSWNVYEGNRAGVAGGGFFCDDGATCTSEHEIYVRNCGANILLDSGSSEAEPTVARFDHITNVGALDVACAAPGPGVRIDKATTAPDVYSFTNSLFWGNGAEMDFAVACDVGCDKADIRVSHSAVQTAHQSYNMSASFGEGIVTPADPLFADEAAGDFHLKSTAGRWTPDGMVKDGESSPALGKADPASAADANPSGVKGPSELGAYGNSVEASLTR